MIINAFLFLNNVHIFTRNTSSAVSQTRSFRSKVFGVFDSRQNTHRFADKSCEFEVLATVSRFVDVGTTFRRKFR